jgi:3-dehydroquinate synthase
VGVKRVEVQLGSRSYPVLIGSGLLGTTEHWAPLLGAGRVLVVSNDVVGPLYLERVLDALPSDRATSFVLPDGEAHKTVESWRSIIDELVRLKAGRDACLVALGGGVIGDLCGFAAASYMRGVGFIQAPTSLLAQVDASVGGKTGVNHPQGKNLIGAFHQPRAVLADVGTLSTLPEREYRAGLAEVVKYGLIRDADFLDWLEKNSAAIKDRAPAAVEHLVEHSIRNKAAVVAADEREAGSRALLNFGHSFGHALETLTEYRGFLHGEAVAIGMVVATRLSESREFLQAGACRRLRALLTQLGLPVTVPQDIAANDIYDCLALDKKTLGGQPRLILLDGPGSARVDTDSSERDILNAIGACQA